MSNVKLSGGLMRFFVLAVFFLVVGCAADVTELDQVTGINVNGTVVTWARPEAREDGTQLSVEDIKGYRIYYGAEQGRYQGQIDIDNGAVEERKLNGIPSGVYFLVITAIDVEGRESLYSSEIRLMI